MLSIIGQIKLLVSGDLHTGRHREFLGSIERRQFFGPVPHRSHSLVDGELATIPHSPIKVLLHDQILFVVIVFIDLLFVSLDNVVPLFARVLESRDCVPERGLGRLILKS